MSAVENSMRIISSEKTQAWHALKINLILQGTSSARLGFEFVVIRAQQKFLQH